MTPADTNLLHNYVWIAIPANGNLFLAQTYQKYGKSFVVIFKIDALENSIRGIGCILHI